MRKPVLIFFMILFTAGWAHAADPPVSEQYSRTHAFYTPNDSHLFHNLDAGGKGKRILARADRHDRINNGSDKRSIGGVLGGAITGNYTSVTVAGQVGYAATDMIRLGAGVNYSFYDQDNRLYKTHYLGLNVWAKFYPVRYLSLVAQPEVHRGWRSGESGNSTKFFGAMLVGAGVTIPVAPRGSLDLLFLYNVIQNDHSPYGNSICYSIGYTFYL